MLSNTSSTLPPPLVDDTCGIHFFGFIMVTFDFYSSGFSCCFCYTCVKLKMGVPEGFGSLK